MGSETPRPRVCWREEDAGAVLMGMMHVRKDEVVREKEGIKSERSGWVEGHVITTRRRR
jgi:hypothetical protein